MLRRHLIATPHSSFRLVDESSRVKVRSYAVQGIPDRDSVRDAEVVSVLAGWDGSVLEDFGNEGRVEGD